MRNVFRFGPCLFVPIMVAGSALYFPWRHHDSWPAYAILFGALIAFCWHVSLVVTQEQKINYVGYAIVNLLIYVVVGFYCLMMVTGDAL